MRRDRQRLVVTAAVLSLLLQTLPARAAPEDEARTDCEQQVGPQRDAGPPREISVDCPDPAVREKLRGLIARVRALRETADLFRRDFKIAECMRDKARDRFWGANGSFAGYWNSVLGMASIAEGGALTKGAGWITTGYDVVTEPTSGSTWAGAGAQVVGDDYVMSKAAEQIIIDGARKANDGFVQMPWAGKGNADFFIDNTKFPDTPITVGQVKKAANVVGAVLAVKGCWDATEEVVGDTSSYFEWRREAKQLQAQLHSIDAQIEAVIKEIEALRERCKPCAKGLARDAAGECQDPCSPAFKLPPCPPGDPLCHGVGQCR